MKDLLWDCSFGREQIRSRSGPSGLCSLKLLNTLRQCGAAQDRHEIFAGEGAAPITGRELRYLCKSYLTLFKRFMSRSGGNSDWQFIADTACRVITRKTLGDGLKSI